MKKIVKIIGLALVTLIFILLIAFGVVYLKMSNASKKNMALLGNEAPELTVDGQTFRDLNKNSSLDPYEDRRATLDERVEDILDQMTLEEKAGMMFITMIGITPNGNTMETPVVSSNPFDLILSSLLPSGSEMIARKKMNNFNILSSLEARVMARFNNNIQKMAERTRLGIPITIASDPRHGVEFNPGTAIASPIFSEWPGTLGLAATRDTLLVKEFGNIARQEYLAIGIRLALHPMADLATEPRWGRINGTFGEDAGLASDMLRAYIMGFQGDSLDQNSVACMTKHFPGGGTNTDGLETHFAYGKEQSYSGDNFYYHVLPYSKGAFAANTAQIMPSYGIPIGQTSEEVAFAFNKDIITHLLRDSLGFNGVVCTDWNIISDTKMMKMMKGGSSAWGVEDLSPIQRVKKVIDAGCDQFGGESIPELIIELVNSGQISDDRIDVSVKRILRDKFRLGLFDDPYIDEEKANQIAGQLAFQLKGKEAQRKSVVLLKNNGLLPLKSGTKVYAEGMFNPEAINQFGHLVDDPADADVILTRIKTPFDPKDDYMIERFLHQGRLNYNDEELRAILGLIQPKPSIVVVNLDRPAILSPINEPAHSLLGEFGASDEILAEIIFGKVNPSGKLPFELPSSPEAVEQQLEDVPYDSKNPLYSFGHGLSY